MATGVKERKKLERLCRYISRSALAEKRLSLTPSGKFRYHPKIPWRDGTTHWPWFVLPTPTVMHAWV